MAEDGKLFFSLETTVGGVTYRSRLEARWAIVFTMLGLRFQYEPTKLDIGLEKRYIPDFWLPTQGCFIEIKPGHPSAVEEDRAKRCAVVTKRTTYIFGCGVPAIGRDGAPTFEDCTEPSVAHGYRYYPDGQYQTLGWMFGVKECCGRLAVCFTAHTDQIPCECPPDAGYNVGYLHTLQQAFVRGRLARWDEW